MEQDWNVLLEGVAEEDVFGQDTEDSTFEYTELDETDGDEKFEKFVDVACLRPLVTLLKKEVAYTTTTTGVGGKDW